VSARSGVLLLALLAVGCGGGERTATAPPQPRVSASAALDDCLRPGPAVQMVKVPAPGEQLPAVVLGSGGATGVVFANQSASIACGWLPYARDVARAGVRSLVFDYGTAERQDEVLAAARWLRAHGARRVVLVGQRDIIVDARRLDMPALWVSSLNDGYTNFAAETRQLYRAARGHARPDHLLVVGGDDHGIDLLTGPQARRVVPAVRRFIRSG
jgi:hypothetical protein